MMGSRLRMALSTAARGARAFGSQAVRKVETPSRNIVRIAAFGVAGVATVAATVQRAHTDGKGPAAAAQYMPAAAKTPAEKASADMVAVAAEKMYLDNKSKQEIYDLLFKFVSEDKPVTADVMWRFARACHDVAMETTDKTKKEFVTRQGYESAKVAIALDANNFACHKWMAIMISDLGDFEGVKTKLLNSFVMKQHFEEAIRLNPKDATSEHLLGIWCFTFADMPWYQRQAAATVFATPPKSTYEEALSHFMHAEEVDPGFYTKNALYIAKTLKAMGKLDEAQVWFKKCLSMHANNADDREAHAEAQKHVKA